MKQLLAVVKLNEHVAAFIKEQGYEVLTEDMLNESNASNIEVIMSNGTGQISKQLLDKLPAVKMIDNFGVGYDGVDTAECARRDIALCTTLGVLTDDVADLAMSLILDVSRQVTVAHNYIQAGKWASGIKLAMGNKVSGKKVGIVGLGNIGKAVAQRCRGFNMEVFYHSLSADNTEYQHKDSLIELAKEVDYLVVCAAATEANRNMINAQVLEALGPSGFLINIARGSLVDEAALCDAITKGTIQGAALDVFASEPHVPQALLNRDNVLLTAHIASATVETRKQMADIVNANFKAFLEGKELPTRIKI